MIYTDEQIIEKIKEMIARFEDEVVEFKEARTNYSFKDTNCGERLILRNLRIG